jgi:hypothetical protein
VESIAKLRVLDSEECRAVRDAVVVLRRHWQRRSAEYPFFTLGAASYLDAPGSRERYIEKALDENRLLAEHFGWVYERLAGVLAGHFGADVEYAGNLALPGYHIYLSHPAFELPIASIHCDTQYRLLEWPFASADFGKAMSFTLAIALPRSGAGLRVWPFHHDEIAGETLQALLRRAGNAPPDYFPYEAGHAAVHSGHRVHQAAPAQGLIASDERITLQGHALFGDGRWVLYW